MAYKFTEESTPSGVELDKIISAPSSSITPNGFVSVDDLGNVSLWGQPTNYRLRKVVSIADTAVVSYTPTSGVSALFVECIGAGGGSGGCVADIGGALSAASGGGGGGAYSAAWLTSNVSGSHTIVIGSGAVTAGAAGNNAGAAGGDTVFKDHLGTIVVRAKGGSGGQPDTAATSPHVGGLGGAGGLASGGIGDIKQDGAPGNPGICLTATKMIGGEGGNGLAGIGAHEQPSGPAGSNLQIGRGFGSGGGGSAVSNTTNVSGSDGAKGAIIIYEFQ